MLFDYGLTLVGFVRPGRAIARAHEEIARRLSAAGHRARGPAELRAAIHDRVEAEVAAHEAAGALDEVDIAVLERRAFAAIGLELDGQLLDDCSRLIQEAWLDGVRIYPDVVPVLTMLRARGLRCGLCSNAPYRPASMHAQLAHVGLDRLLDAAVFSSEVRWRKPAPQTFAAALAALGAQPRTTVFVGDRLREDVAGAQAAGMRAVLIDRGDASAAGGTVGVAHPDAVIRSLSELPGVLGLTPTLPDNGRRI